MTPIRFLTIGSGQVFTKYWLPAHAKGIVNIVGAITIDDPSISHIPIYFTKSETHTLEILKSHSLNYDAIALLLPVDKKLNLLKLILNDPLLKNKKVFIEKPYTHSIDELEEYFDLIKTYSSRLHFAEKYAYGRADILIKHLLKMQDYPLFVSASMIEGSSYFSKLSGDLANNLFVKDGPELDIGFHMLNIISRYVQGKKRKIVDFQVDQKSVMELREIRPYFLLKYGFAAEVIYTLDNGVKIPLFLQAGKADCANDRHIRFDFPAHSVIQNYTVINSKDPVYLLENDKLTLLEEHSEDHLYYPTELTNEYFCKQTRDEQINSIDVNRICLEIKYLRENGKLKKALPIN